MPDTIEIDGQALTLDDIVQRLGLDAVEPPYDDEDLQIIRDAIAAANQQDSFLSDLLAASVIFSLFPLLPGGNRQYHYSVPRAAYLRGSTLLGTVDINRAIVQEQLAVAARTRQFGEDLVSGRISLDQYGDRMAGEIYNTHLRMMQAGAGTRSLLGEEHLRQLRDRLLGTPEFVGELEALARHLKRIKENRLTPAEIISRSERYGKNTRPSYEEARKASLVLQGEWEGIRLLEPGANHCAQCPGYEQTDFVPVSNLVPVGVACDCRGNCRCQWVLRKIGT